MPPAQIISIQVPIDLAKKLSLIPDILVAVVGAVWHTSGMPNQGSSDKTFLTVRIPRALYHRIKRLAQQRGETVTDLVLSILNRSVQDVELTPEDYRKIADEIEKASRK